NSSEPVTFLIATSRPAGSCSTTRSTSTNGYWVGIWRTRPATSIPGRADGASGAPGPFGCASLVEIASRSRDTYCCGLGVGVGLGAGAGAAGAAADGVAAAGLGAAGLAGWAARPAAPALVIASREGS